MPEIEIFAVGSGLPFFSKGLCLLNLIHSWTHTGWIFQDGVRMVISRDMQRALENARPELGVHMKFDISDLWTAQGICRNLPSSRLASISLNLSLSESDLFACGAEVMGLLKRVLECARRLETLNLNFEKPGTLVRHLANQKGGWVFSQDFGKLPPVTTLFLDFYDWPSVLENSDHFSQVWDFSKLKNLELVNINLEYFFEGVPFETLVNLEALRLTDIQRTPGRYRFTQPTQLPPNEKVIEQLWPQLRKLKVLSIKSFWNRYISVSSFKYFGMHLRKLDLSGHSYKKDEWWFVEQVKMTIEDLQALVNECPMLEKLSIKLSPNNETSIKNLVS